MKMLFHISVVVALLITSCATGSDRPTLFAGLSRDRLKAKFGEPIRIEHLFGGAQDWYYSFSRPLEVQATSDHDVPVDTESAAIAVTKSSGTQELPVHISPEGFVMEPLPEGHIVR
jgi:hypothetical protein